MYLSVYGEAVTEKVVEKSRFITFVSHVEGEEEASAFLARIRALHPQATHVCYAYVCDKAGNGQRFSDAGEPQGTAGMPILAVLKARKLCETAVAVVRYFGGIKLGAGGLARAYSSCAAEGCAAAEIREYDTCVVCVLRAEYSEVSPLMRFLEREGYPEYGRDFGERARFTVAVRESAFEKFSAALNEFTNGKVGITAGERYFYPFPIK